MIIKQYIAVIAGSKIETRRTSTKDTYKVGHIYSVVPKRAQPTVYFKWRDGDIDIWHHHMPSTIPQTFGLIDNTWQPLKVKVLEKRWEPLCAITEQGAIDEGIVPNLDGTFICDLFPDEFRSAVEAYRHLWDSINGKTQFRWANNPQVCVHKLELVKPQELLI